jgi:hypothetical protein
MNVISNLKRDALSVLADVCSLSPDVRLGQLMSHLGFLCDMQLGKGMAYVDDDELLAIIHHHRDELRARANG